MPYLAKILLYPVKSLDGIEVENARVLASGALQHDREFAIFDEQGRFVNGKRHAKIHLLRAQFALFNRTISLQIPDSDLQRIFHLDEERQALEATLSDFLGFGVTLRQNSLMGFPDDTSSPGPTVISTATLAEVASWFPGLNIDEIRRRMRANIEIDGVPAFWEDQLFSEQGDLVSFRVGDVDFFGVKPCQRCIVPTRDSYLGEAYPNFQKIFVTQRQATLPNWVASSPFNHFYRLSVNTELSPSSAGKILQIGDEIDILS
ncbi:MULTISPECIES: MOSC domain-containing protein [Nostoc]|uniref:MOSC N-terminal beta barrel domain-containing protein n=2 Tax=Nostoc TaxID=1177 RepID=A0ABR8I2J6_9NOSO|nr:MULTISPECIES: MOSC N-terminal beta barrel domain-containing protein [Nostoc]MBD2560178.1 MOSC N-terminal beta barrel domain-containing protein [Nostoc linckia FACHB-391]MBD2645834.1 MOSC N-terminal beta barrel domain-containing protein [Nostoc foliaceum FACHB-393]